MGCTSNSIVPSRDDSSGERELRKRKTKSTPYGDVVRELTNEWLGKRGWTQQDLADRLGRPQSFVSKLLNREKVTLDLDLVVEIINAFDIPISSAWRTIRLRVESRAPGPPELR